MPQANPNRFKTEKGATHMGHVAFTAPSRSACGGQAPTSFRWAHSHAAADPSEIPLLLLRDCAPGAQGPGIGFSTGSDYGNICR